MISTYTRYIKQANPQRQKVEQWLLRAEERGMGNYFLMGFLIAFLFGVMKGFWIWMVVTVAKGCILNVTEIEILSYAYYTITTTKR